MLGLTNELLTLACEYVWGVIISYTCVHLSTVISTTQCGTVSLSHHWHHGTETKRVSPIDDYSKQHPIYLSIFTSTVISTTHCDIASLISIPIESMLESRHRNPEGTPTNISPKHFPSTLCVLTSTVISTTHCGTVSLSSILSESPPASRHRNLKRVRPPTSLKITGVCPSTLK